MRKLLLIIFTLMVVGCIESEPYGYHRPAPVELIYNCDDVCPNGMYVNSAGDCTCY